MKVNPSQETAASLLGTAISRDKLLTDFQASLDVARQNQQKRGSKAPDVTAMSQAMNAALKELEDYIAKGPIAHMREKILEEMGLSEEDLAKMPADQREAIEKTIAARIKEMLLADSGINPKNLQAHMQLLGLSPTRAVGTPNTAATAATAAMSATPSTHSVAAASVAVTAAERDTQTT